MASSTWVPRAPGAGSILRRLTETERNWLFSALLVAASVIVCAVIHQFEIRAGRWSPEARAIVDPGRSAMSFVGIPHFLIAFLFTAYSRRMRSGRAWARFAVLAAAGGVLCLGFRHVDFAAPALAELLLFSYFFIHECRDEVFFYYANGDGSASERGTAAEWVLVRLPLLLVSAVVAALALGVGLFGLGGEWVQAEAAALPDLLRGVLGIAPAVGVVFAVLALRRRWRSADLGSIAAFLRAHVPIVRVFVASFVLIAVGLALGLRSHTIILLHVSAWYVFSVRQLRKRPAPAPSPARGSWSWIRGTPSGFTFLHAGLVILMVAAAGVWTYGFRQDPRLLGFKVFLDSKSFAYWTIVHVSVSFTSR
ncbi:MAG: hypothetical protein ABI592_01365 [Acidobacteriota bacterium]